MGRRLAVPALETTGLLPASYGHVLRGHTAPTVRPDAIEPALDRVVALYRASLRERREHGFLAYVPRAGASLVLEEDAVGSEDSIAWHWRHPEATVAYSFHTHPSSDAAIVPSGIDAVGALIRGDHIVYILTMDGRLAGWRFRPDSHHARAVEAAVRALDDAKRFEHRYVQFLYDAFDGLRAKVMEPVYAARIELSGDDGARLVPCAPARPFLTAWEAGAP